MGLNEVFSQIRGLILAMDPMPPITSVFSLVLQDETKRQLRASSSSAADSEVAFAVKNAPKQPQ